MMMLNSRLLVIVAALTLCAELGLAETVADTFPVESQLTEVTPSGQTRALAGATVWLVATKRKPGPHAVQTNTLGRWSAVSDSNGKVRFGHVLRHNMTQYRIIVPFQGVTYRSAEFQPGQPAPKNISVYHVSPKPSDVSMRLHWNIDVGEVYLRVTQTTRIHNESLTTIDYTHSTVGLRVPTLSYMVGEQVLTWGVYPPGKVHGNPMPSSGQGRIVSEDGSIVYRGPVPPGDRLFFQVSYDIPYEDESVRLGALSDMPVTDAAATVRWTAGVYPKVRLGSKHRAMRSNQEGLTRTDLLHLGNLAVGQPFIITFDHLPAQTSIPRWIALHGTVLALFVFLMMIIGLAFRRRQVA